MPLIKRSLIHLGSHVKYIDGEGHVHDKEVSEMQETGTGEDYSEPAKLSDADIQKIRNDVITKAKSEAEIEKQKILEDIEREREEAKRAGFEEGKKETLGKYADAVKEGQALIEQGNIERSKIIEAAEPEILKLSIRIATQVIKSEVSMNRDITLNIVREAIGKVSDNKNVVIKVNQNDLETIRLHKDEVEDLLDSKNITIVADKKVEEGGCYIETSLGYIDARIATKLQMIEDTIVGIYEKDSEERRDKLEKKGDISLVRTDRQAEAAGEEGLTDEDEDISLDEEEETSSDDAEVAEELETEASSEEDAGLDEDLDLGEDEEDLSLDEDSEDAEDLDLETDADDDLGDDLDDEDLELEEEDL